MKLENIPKFGEDMKRQEFTLREDVTYVNHGALGAVPRRVQEEQKRILDEINKYPDLFQYEQKVKQENGRKSIAEFIHADPEDVVLVQNTSTGYNTVLKSFKWKPGDIVLGTNHSYCGVVCASEAATKAYNVKDVKTEYLQLKFPIESEDDIVEMYRQYFKINQVKLAVIDHITSVSACKMPIDKLIPLCKEYGVLTLIDGAHAPGQLQLNMKELDPDFYTGSLNKWLYTPAGCAMLYIKKEHQSWVKPLVTVDSYIPGIQSAFFWQGSRAYSPYCVIPEAIQFHNDIGGCKKLQEHASTLLNEATDLLTSSWKTEKLQIPKSMEAPYMRLVMLPKLKEHSGLATFDEVEKMMKEHIVKHKFSVKYTSIDDRVYVRLSANVYNTREDYHNYCRFICNQME